MIRDVPDRAGAAVTGSVCVDAFLNIPSISCRFNWFPMFRAGIYARVNPGGKPPVDRLRYNRT
jgi:hypothetical protein